LIRHALRVEQCLKSDIARRRKRVNLFQQRGQRESNPRYDHRPAFYATMPVDTFFRWRQLQQFIDIESLRLVDQTTDLYGPGTRHEPLRG
jgi:hypothetical protein